MKYVVNSIRIIVGVLFIFSGLVKANDPAGLSYKMHEFFEAWGMQSWNSYALTFSVLMIAFEIIAGAALLLGWQKKINLWLLLGLILFFTFLTGYAWLAKKEDGSAKFAACGCFGDCIPLKPNQSFFKDIALLVMILFLLVFQKYIQPLFNNKITWALLAAVVAFSFFIQKYTLDHLPFKDCLSFKVGNNILEKKRFKADSVRTIYTYRKDGKEYLVEAPNYPQWMLDEDTTYVIDEAKTKTITISEGNKADMIRDFSLNAESGSDTTEAILSQKGYVYLFLMTDFKTNSNSWDAAFGKLVAQCKNNYIPVYVVSNKAVEARKYFSKFDYLKNAVFFCDEKPLLAAARTRPTLMVLNNGTIQAKYSYKDLSTVINNKERRNPKPIIPTILSQDSLTPKPQP
jgi:uncharacterized membrane protein YphA (DoxX/SURF4 family)